MGRRNEDQARRLSTNALVLISRSGFTKEAEAVAQAYGIETLGFDALDDSSAERLFGNSSSLWSKVFSLTASKVVIGVPAIDALPAERVAVNPDNLIYNHKGEEIGSAEELVDLLLNAEHVFLEFGKLGDESHRSFQIRWEPARDKEGILFVSKSSTRMSCVRSITWRSLACVAFRSPNFLCGTAYCVASRSLGAVVHFSAKRHFSLPLKVKASKERFPSRTRVYHEEPNKALKEDAALTGAAFAPR